MLIYCVLGSAPCAPDRRAGAREAHVRTFLISFYDHPRAYESLGAVVAGLELAEDQSPCTFTASSARIRPTEPRVAP